MFSPTASSRTIYADMNSNQPSRSFVEIRQAFKKFDAPEGGKITALSGVSLEVDANEFITLLGPSGCGKTTLLRTISGFEALDSGEIFIDGQPMADSPPHRRPVNTVFQNYALFPHLSVGDNVGYSLDVAHVARGERNNRVAEALNLVGLTGLERRKPSQLSGGQQQRVALARCIINRPKLLLLDEPLSALDRNLRQSMQLELKNLQHELGISFVFVTHDQEEALTMSDRIVVMDGGCVQQIGTPTDVYDRPSNVFVANFIGESNLFRTTVNAKNGNLCEVETESGVRLNVGSNNLNIGERATVLIRPEHLSLQAEDSRDDTGLSSISGVLKQSVFVGTDFQLIVELPGGDLLKAMIRDSARGAVNGLSPGTVLKFYYQPASAHVIPVEDAA